MQQGLYGLRNLQEFSYFSLPGGLVDDKAVVELLPMAGEGTQLASGRGAMKRRAPF